MKDNNFKTGTTTVGIVCKDGVVLAAEKKATMGYLIANKSVKKIIKLSDYMAMTTAGSVGDAQALERYIKAEIKIYELEEEARMPVKAVATLLSNILHSTRFFPYIVQLLIGGYDEKPRLFSFDPTGSFIEEKKFFSTGSGSVMALGVLEDSYKKEINTKEGESLAIRAIKAAIQRDIASGGEGIDVAVVDKDGVHFSENVMV
ncbi:MAG TPA: archaeal proteasome endopeptidase complex subunit beta [Candidatus Aenigmarchaeota archaeon]|nr:archaeal proteasome endopeptidase complex subunit beta [Candidatus Aenigmarchaeota archaeon]